MAGRSDIEAGKAFIRLYLKNDLTKQLSGAVKAAGDVVSKAGASMSSAGMKLGAAGAAIAAPLVASVAAGARFEDVLLDIKASTGATSGELDKLKQAALSSKVGPTSAAESFLELLKAGVSLDDVLRGVGDTAIAFGAVGKMNVGEAAVVMADAMKVFGVEADAAANTISAAADASSTDIGGMAQAFSQVSAVAALADQSIESTATALALLANAGVKGSDAGTSLKTMLLKLMAPTDTTATGLNMLGLSVESFRGADGKMLPLVDMLGRLQKATAGMDETAKDAAFAKVFGTDAIRAAAILSSAGVGGFSEMQDGMASALPVGEKFATMMGGLSGAKAALLASLERVAIVVAESLQPAIVNIVPYVENAVRMFGEFAKGNTWLGPALAATAVGLTGIGAALIVLGATATTLGGVISALGTLAGLLPALTVVAGAAGVLSVLEGIGAIDFGTLLESVRALGDYLGGVFTDLWGTLKTAAIGSWEGISTAIKAGDWESAGDIAMAGLQVAMAGGIQALTTMWEDFMVVLSELFAGIPISLIESLESLANHPLGKLILGPGLVMGLKTGGKALKEALANRVTASKDLRDERVADAASRVGDAQAALDRLTTAEATREAGRAAEAAKPKAPEAFVENAVEEVVEPLTVAERLGQGQSMKDIAAEPEMAAGFKMLGGWLSEAGRVARKVATTNVSMLGGSLADTAENAGIVSPEMRKQLGIENWEAKEAAPVTPRGVSIGPTFSAEGAIAAGFMGSGGSPEERTASTLFDMRKQLEELNLINQGVRVSNEYVATLYERFLAAMAYG